MTLRFLFIAEVHFQSGVGYAVVGGPIGVLYRHRELCPRQKPGSFPRTLLVFSFAVLPAAAKSVPKVFWRASWKFNGGV